MSRHIMHYITKHARTCGPNPSNERSRHRRATCGSKLASSTLQRKRARAKMRRARSCMHTHAHTNAHRHARGDGVCVCGGWWVEELRVRAQLGKGDGRMAWVHMYVDRCAHVDSTHHHQTPSTLPTCEVKGGGGGNIGPFRPISLSRSRRPLLPLSSRAEASVGGRGMDGMPVGGRARRFMRSAT